MWDVPNIVQEMREIEKQDNTYIKHDKTLLDAPLKHDFFKNDDMLDDMWFQMWCVL